MKDLSVPQWVTPLLTAIRAKEASLGYNMYVGRKEAAPFGDLANKTLAEVIAIQRANPVPSWDAPGRTSSAIGGYQIVGRTLRSLVEQHKLPLTLRFTPQLQDWLAFQLLKGRGIEAYRAGRTSVAQFMRGLSQEWASIRGTHLPVVTRIVERIREVSETRPLAPRQARQFPESLLPNAIWTQPRTRPVQLSRRPTMRPAVPVAPRAPAASRPRVGPIVRDRIEPQVTPASVPRIRVEVPKAPVPAAPVVRRPTALPVNPSAPVILRFANGERLMQDGKSYFRATPADEWKEVVA